MRNKLMGLPKLPATTNRESMTNNLITKYNNLNKKIQTSSQKILDFANEGNNKTSKLFKKPSSSTIGLRKN